MAEEYYIGPDGKEVSSAVLVVTEDNMLLACHSTGKAFKDGNYDLPKGHIDKGETAKEAAVRELREETGIKAKESDLKDLGEFPYNRVKNLHLFWYDIGKLDTKDLKCTSYFTMYGKKQPEVNGFKLTPLSDLSPFFKVIQKVLNKVL